MKSVEIGTVYVDAGMVMIRDPCYSLPETARHRGVAASWDRFCDAVGNASSHAEPLGRGLGLVVKVPYGDGQYPVMAEMSDHGLIRSVTIDFDPYGSRTTDGGCGGRLAAGRGRGRPQTSSGAPD